MSLLNFFRKRETVTKNVQQTDPNLPVNEIVQQASSRLYPSKIVISTTDKVKEGFGIETDNMSILPIDISNELLGAKIRYHLSLTRINQPIPSDYSAHYKQFLKAAGFKSRKDEYKEAIYLSVDLGGSILTISPSLNGGDTGKNRGYRFIGNDITMDNTIGNAELGGFIREAWNLCE